MAAPITIALIPCDANKQLSALGIRMHITPGVGYTQTTCDICGCDAWIGPRSKLVLEAHPGTAEKLCVPCATFHRQGLTTVSLGNPNDATVIEY